MNFKIIYGSILVYGLFISACEDQGNPVTPPNNPPPATSSDTVHFATDVLPLFTGTKYGCTGCHGSQNNLFLDSYNGVLSGNSGYSTASASLHGPVVTPGDGEGSIIVKKLRGSPTGWTPSARMPFGGNPMDEADIQKIVTWIDQGALNN